MIARMLAILTVLLGVVAIVASDLAVSSIEAQNRPNFVVIVVDDLDSASVAHMPAVNRQLAQNGVTFTQFFATTPLCCPSRASILRGQYAHNHGVLRNTGEDAGFAAFQDSGSEAETIATKLDDAGYETALVGKYLNGYSIDRKERGFIPPGWDFWVAGVDHAAYNGFNYDLNVNGEIAHRGRNEQDYMTDVLAAHAFAFLDRANHDHQPFLLYLAPYAPHSPATPAPRHKNHFSGATAPRTPAFNERNAKDKPAWVRGTGRLSEERISRIDSDYQRRLESLLAVDEMVDAVMQRLENQGLLESTYILFLSDNGYFLGEHRQPHGKDAPYDAASRIPFIIRGPGIPSGSSMERLALNIDLFPTILDLAGLETPSFVDGRSLEPVISGNDRGWRKAALLEGFGKESEYVEGSESSTPPFRALRGEDVLYVEYETGERELYNLRKDPHQMSNIAPGAPKTLLRGYSRHLKSLAACAGSECQRIENEPLPRKPGAANGKSRKNQTRPDPNRQRSAVEQEIRAAGASSGERRLTVGGDDDSIAQVHFEIPRRVATAGELLLRVHVASVETPGTLVATLETDATDAEDSARHRERLAGTHVSGSGWITLDVSGVLGDSSGITIGLRGREGATLSVSSPDSDNPPRLDPGRPEQQLAGSQSKSDRQGARDRPSNRHGGPHQDSSGSQRDR